jgi:Zn-finger nucleic acid-binding protein
VPNCANCAAPLPVGSISCDYCGSRNDVDLKGIHFYTTHETDSDRICPRCSISLKTIDLKMNGRFLIERCDGCLGLFFDPGELEAVLEASVSNVFEINRSQLGQLNRAGSGDALPVAYIKCPVCSQIMNRVNFGARSGVVVDRCREHGIWLDGGELRRLCEWMKAGGKLLDQERQEQLKKEQATAAKKRQLPDHPALADDSGSFDLYSGTLRKEDPDLFAIIFKAIRFLAK